MCPQIREKKTIFVKVRISQTEKNMIRKLSEADPEMTPSRLFRESLRRKCDEMGIKCGDGIGSFVVG